MEKISSMGLWAMMVLGVITLVLSLGWDIYNPMIYMTYTLCAVCAVAAFVAFVIGMTKNPDTIKGTIIGLGIMLTIVGISYAVASDEIMSYYKGDPTAFAVKWSGAGLYMFYVLFAAAIGSIIFSGVSKMMKG